MDIYILSEKDNLLFAHQLLNGIKNIGSVSAGYFTERTKADFDLDMLEGMENANVILAIIDHGFSESATLISALRLAKMFAQKNKNQVLIPVVLGDAKVPYPITGMRYITCASNSEEDLHKARLLIRKALEHRYFHFSSVSKKKKNNTLYMRYTTLLSIIIAVFSMLLTLLYAEGSFASNAMDASIPFVVITSICVAITIIFIEFLFIQKMRSKEADEKELDSYSMRLEEAIVLEKEENEHTYSKTGEKEIDALGRMMINLEDIREFYTWSQKQAKASFVLAVAMCVVGFALMIVAVVFPVVFRLSFQTSIIPAIGSITTELIAGTALVVYRNSLSQLNHYHKALHEDERFLSSINLLSKFSTVEAQDDMLREIIRSEIQMNLTGIQENEALKMDSQNSTSKSKK